MREAPKPSSRNVKVQVAIKEPVKAKVETLLAPIQRPKVYQTPGAKPVLGYWDIRGLAQAIRYQLIYQNIDFVDYYHKHTEDIQSRQIWLDQKDSFGLDFPNLPYFIDSDLRITEHMAIHQYIADKWMPELLGKSLAQRAKVDMLAGVVWDLKKAATIGCYTDIDRKTLKT